MKAEMTAYLRDNPQAFDVIVSADALVYFGDLRQVLAAFPGALRPDGMLVFSLEHARGDIAGAGYRLELHGRYSHDRTHVMDLLAVCGRRSPRPSCAWRPALRCPGW